MQVSSVFLRGWTQTCWKKVQPFWIAVSMWSSWLTCETPILQISSSVFLSILCCSTPVIKRFQFKNDQNLISSYHIDKLYLTMNIVSYRDVFTCHQILITKPWKKCLCNLTFGLKIKLRLLHTFVHLRKYFQLVNFNLGIWLNISKWVNWES